MQREYIPVPIMDSDLPLCLIHAGITACDSNYKIIRKNSAVGALEFIISGKGTIVSNKNTFSVNQGSGFILYPGDDMEYHADKSDPWKKIWINFQGALPEKLAQIYNLREKTLLDGVDEYIYRIHDILRAEKDPTVIANEISLVFMELFQKNSLKTEEKTDSQILKEYIDRNVYKKISTDSLAKVIRKSPEHTIRIFKKEFGITPYEYHIRNKLKSADNFLKNSDMPIKDIAYTLGFSDEHYFSAFFKEKTGKTPRDTRKNSE